MMLLLVLVGDEYVILLPRIHEIKDIHKVIDKIRSSIGDDPITFENHLITVKTSIGYSRFDSKMNSVDELLHKADRSMYSDKQGHMGSILM
ncbi:GGDEF domain-containing protein [Aliivibrio wodanis]|uniref:GGDEF domain-containing protein n=1 Tax=Aliivibrio wodanis TaxID=80852 RepID=UPI00406C8EF9